MSASLLLKLSQSPLCRGLTETEVQELLAIAEELSVHQGAALFNEGDLGDGLYIVLEGHVDVLKKDSNGRPQSLASIGSGSVIGEMCLIGGTAARSATAVVGSEAKLLKISAKRFSALVKGNNIAALKAVHNLAQVVSRRLALMDEQLVNLLERAPRKEELSDFQRILTDWSL